MKKLLSIFMSLVISFCVIYHFNLNVVNAEIDKIVKKETFQENEKHIRYLIEFYESGKIIITPYFTGWMNDVTNIDLINIQIPCENYKLEYNIKQCENSSYIIETIDDTYNSLSVKYEFDKTGYIKHGDLAEFTLIPTNFSSQAEFIIINDRNINTIFESDSILKFDINNDGLLDAVDSTMILSIYAINSTGGNIKTLTDYKNYLNENEDVIEGTTESLL